MSPSSATRLSLKMYSSIILSMNLSLDGEKIMSLATKQAQAAGGIWLATEHLLLGFLKGTDTLSKEVVQARMSHKELLDFLSRIMDLSPSLDDEPICKTPRLEEALSFAERRALESGGQVEPVHLFLGLMASGSEGRQGMAQRIMLEFEIDSDEWAQEAEAAMTSR